MNFHDVIEACATLDALRLTELLREGANPNIRDHEGNPLWKVVLHGSNEAAQAQCLTVLAQHGLRLDRATPKGSTILMALEHRPELVAPFLRATPAMGKRVMRYLDRLGARGENLLFWQEKLADLRAEHLSGATIKPQQKAARSRL